MAMPTPEFDEARFYLGEIAALLSSVEIASQLAQSGKIGHGTFVNRRRYFMKSDLSSFLEERFTQSHERGHYEGYTPKDLVDMTFEEGLVSAKQLAQTFGRSLHTVEFWVYHRRLSSIDLSMREGQRRLYRAIPSIALREAKPLLENIERLQGRAEERRRAEKAFEGLKERLSDEGIPPERIEEYLEMIGEENITEGQMPLLRDLILTGLYPHTFITTGEISGLPSQYKRSRQRVHVLINQGRLYSVSFNGKTYVSRESWFGLMDSPPRPAGRPRKQNA